MKNRSHRFDTAILCIHFHRFPLLIDKNHLIATDFYRLTTPTTRGVVRRDGKVLCPQPYPTPPLFLFALSHKTGLVTGRKIMASVAVVGGGIIGLSSAVCILERDPRVKVTLIADKFTPNTTSDGAAGLIMPFFLENTPIHLQR